MHYCSLLSPPTSYLPSLSPPLVSVHYYCSAALRELTTEKYSHCESFQSNASTASAISTSASAHQSKSQRSVKSTSSFRSSHSTPAIRSLTFLFAHITARCFSAPTVTLYLPAAQYPNIPSHSSGDETIDARTNSLTETWWCRRRTSKRSAAGATATTFDRSNKLAAECVTTTALSHLLPDVCFSSYLSCHLSR